MAHVRHPGWILPSFAAVLAGGWLTWAIAVFVLSAGPTMSYTQDASAHWLLALCAVAIVVVIPGSEHAAVRRRVGLGGLVIAALFGARMNIRGLRDEFDSGLVDPATITALVGTSAVVVGALALVFLVGRAGFVRRTLIRTAALTATVAVVLMGIGVGVGQLVRDSPVDATTADRADPAAVPQELSGELWEWSTNSPLRAMYPAGAGVIVLAGDRLTALDGATGAERWHYEPPNDFFSGIVASRDGKVVIYLTSKLATFLDANTGDVLGQIKQPLRSGLGGWTNGWALGPEWVMATSEAMVMQVGREELIAWNLRSGDASWEWKPPSGCALRYQHSALDSVVVSTNCGEVVALDGRTGDVLWRHVDPWPTEGVGYSDQLLVTLDGRYVFRDPGSFISDQEPKPTAWAADIRTGERVQIPAGRHMGGVQGNRLWLDCDDPADAACRDATLLLDPSRQPDDPHRIVSVGEDGIGTTGPTYVVELAWGDDVCPNVCLVPWPDGGRRGTPIQLPEGRLDGQRRDDLFFAASGAVVIGLELGGSQESTMIVGVR